jgi:hypothetical protein
MSTDMFCEETSRNYFPKHPNQHPSLYFGNLTLISQRQSLRILCKAISPVFRKIVIELLKCKLSI